MSFRKDNLHGGRLWANRNECTMTNKMAGQILERVYNSRKVTEAQLKKVRHTLSYSYYLMTGRVRENWPEVKAQWDSFNLAELPQSQKPVKAVRIPVPENLKEAWTKPWTPVNPWSRRIVMAEKLLGKPFSFPKHFTFHHRINLNTPDPTRAHSTTIVATDQMPRPHWILH